MHLHSPHKQLKNVDWDDLTSMFNGSLTSVTCHLHAIIVQIHVHKDDTASADLNKTWGAATMVAVTATDAILTITHLLMPRSNQKCVRPASMRSCVAARSEPLMLKQSTLVYLIAYLSYLRSAPRGLPDTDMPGRPTSRVGRAKARAPLNESALLGPKCSRAMSDHTVLSTQSG